VNRKWLWVGLLVALMLAAAVFVVNRTEWVEEEVSTPAIGEARYNHYYAVQQLLRQLGGHVRQHTHLQDMPPRNARLFLDSHHWNMLDDRSEALRQWVHAGGHLVMNEWMTLEDDALDWLPIWEDPPNEEDEEETSPPVSRQPDTECVTLTEPDGVVPYYVGDPRGFSFCRLRRADTYVHLPNDETGRMWQVDGPHGTEIVRMRYGKGTVTVVANASLFANFSVLRGDHTLLAAATFQAEPGAIYWFMTELSRPSLARSLWQRLWPAIVLAAVALLLFVWRSWARFGPVLLPPSLHRRSMREQVHGTGQFLARHDRPALHAAQVRALHTVAGRHLPGWATLDTTARAAALARATGLPQQALAAALDPHATRDEQAWLHALELLERARRILETSSSSDPHVHHSL